MFIMSSLNKVIYDLVFNRIPPQVLVGLPENQDKRVSKLDFTAMLVASIDRFDLLSSRADPIDLIELLDDASAIVDHLAQTIG